MSEQKTVSPMKSNDLYLRIERADGSVDELGIINTNEIDPNDRKLKMEAIKENTRRLHVMNAKTYLKRDTITKLPDMDAFSWLEARLINWLYKRRINRLKKLASN